MEIILTDTAKELQDKLGYSFIPTRATDGSSGYDLRACIAEPTTLHADTSLLIPVGFSLQIGKTTNVLGEILIAGLLLPRSGLGSINGIVLGNLVGLIDSDYQDQWYCSVWNRSDSAYTILPGQKIAQVIFIPTINIDNELFLVDEFSNTTDRNGGHGSTGEF